MGTRGAPLWFLWGVVGASLTACIAILCARPKILVVITLTSVLFGQAVSQVVTHPVVAAADDALVALTIVYLPVLRLVKGQTLRRPPGTFLWFGVIVLGVLGGLVNGVSITYSFGGAYLVMKGPLFGYAVAQVAWAKDDVARLLSWSVRLAVLIVLCASANMLAPSVWSSLLSNTGVAGYRSSTLPSLIGPFVHPSFLAQISGLCAIAILANGQLSRNSRFALVSGLLAAGLLSFRKKSLISLPLGMLVSRSSWRAAWFWVAALPVAIVAVLANIAPIERFVRLTYNTYFRSAETSSPRVALYQGAVELASRDFPLGAGFSRWGSQLAKEQYSIEYIRAGFAAFDGLNPSDMRYATDTFWPIILGETGVLGLCAYTAALVVCWRFFSEMTSSQRAHIKVLGSVGRGWMALLIVESLAAPVFLGPPTFVWLFALVGLSTALQMGDPPVLTEPAEGAGRMGAGLVNSAKE
ncbi:MAG: hypothetical protein VX410_06445 [Actinomycetota bacterium]|nr:hypothetical protein [Actinomycetota bacterium]